MVKESSIVNFYFKRFIDFAILAILVGIKLDFKFDFKLEVIFKNFKEFVILVKILGITTNLNLFIVL